MTKTDDERKLIVVSKTHREFTQWCYEHDISPTHRRIWWFSSPDQVRGFKEDWLLILSAVSDEPYLISHFETVYGMIVLEDDDW